VVWDIGANDGTYSRLISKYVDQVVSMDADHVAIGLNDKRNTENNIKNVIPLVIDITNPSPMGGFALQERKSLSQRSQPDVLVVLALVHHLCITSNIPLWRLVDYFAEYACDVLIEFVDRGDSQVTKLLEHKELSYLEYNKQSFEAEFARCFLLQQQSRLGNSERILYLFSRKD
jgi:ribosomal protein L11 methylase PrmA